MKQLLSLKIPEKLKTVLHIGDCAVILKKHTAQHESQRSDRAQTAHQETWTDFRSQRCRGKCHRHHPGSHNLTRSIQVFFTLRSIAGKGERDNGIYVASLNSCLQGLSGCFCHKVTTPSPHERAALKSMLTTFGPRLMQHFAISPM